MLARTFATVSIAALMVGDAFALEGKALMEKWIAEMRDNGSEVTWSTFVESGSDGFSMTGVKMTSRNDDVVEIKAVTADGLRETDDGRVIYDSFSFSGLEGAAGNGARFTVSAFATADGDWPVEAMRDGIDDADRNKRVRFGNFTINGFAFKDDGNTAATIDAITFNDVDFPLDDEFMTSTRKGSDAAPATIGLASLRNLAGSAEGNAFGLGTFALTELRLPVGLGQSMKGLDWVKIYKSFVIEDVSFDFAGTRAFSLDSMTSNLIEISSGDKIRSDARIDNFMVNFKAIPDPNAQQVLGMLGYDKLQMDADGVGTYALEGGRIEVEKSEFRFREMFDLGMDYAISGYTPKVIEDLNRLQVEAMEKGRSDLDPGKVMGILADLKLERFGLKLTDRSLTGKLLDFQAGQMGTTAEQLAAGAPMLLSAGMAGLQMPELTQMVAKAVGTFLQDQGALSVEMKPSEPVSVAKIMTVGQSDPKQLPDLLQLEVTGR